VSGEKFGRLVGCAAAAPAQTTAKTIEIAPPGALVLRIKNLDIP
jgi:hypothetical protein